MSDNEAVNNIREAANSVVKWSVEFGIDFDRDIGHLLLSCICLKGICKGTPLQDGLINDLPYCWKKKIIK